MRVSPNRVIQVEKIGVASIPKKCPASILEVFRTCPNKTQTRPLYYRTSECEYHIEPKISLDHTDAMFLRCGCG